MLCEVCAPEGVPRFDFAVLLSRFEGQWLFSRKKGFATWETQGGHIEPGETLEQAARRELYEESGACEFTLTPLCAYWADRGEGRRYGMAYIAQIERLDPLPESEIAEVRRFDGLPDPLSYPDITPKLFAEAVRHLARGA